MSEDRSRDSSPEGSANSGASQESEGHYPMGTPQGSRSNTPVASPSAHGHDTEQRQDRPEPNSRIFFLSFCDFILIYKLRYGKLRYNKT